MPLTLLEVGGGIIGLGIVGFIATRQTAQGTGVVFSSPNPTSVAAIESANASDFAAQQSALTARATIGAQLALGLAQADTTNRANSLAADTTNKTTEANLAGSLGAQATQLKIATMANSSTNYQARLAASVANYKTKTDDGTAAGIAKLGASSTNYATKTNAGAAVNIAKSQATASVAIAGIQGKAQTAIASSQAQAQEQVAASQAQAQTNAANAAASAQKSASMWGGISSIASLATAFL